jgi:hypothetical protein
MSRISIRGDSMVSPTGPVEGTLPKAEVAAALVAALVTRRATDRVELLAGSDDLARSWRTVSRPFPGPLEPHG